MSANDSEAYINDGSLRWAKVVSDTGAKID
ncbi:hypothetical protein ABIE33_005580 [Ensifer sp. 4252]